MNAISHRGVLREIRYHAARNKGAVGLEALLSIILLFVAFYALWGVALVIYNQSRLNTATQLAAQSSILIFNRRAYRGQDNGRYQNAYNQAQHVGWSVFRENSCGMLPDEITGEAADDDCYAAPGQPPPGLQPVDGGTPNDPIGITCSNALDGIYTTQNCINGGYQNAQALKVTVKSQVNSPFDWLSPVSPVDAGRTHSVAQLNAQASAYAFGPPGPTCGSPGAGC